MSTSKPKLTDVLSEWMGVFMQHSMRQNMQFWRESKLSMPQGIVMSKLARVQMCGVSDVAEFLDVTPAAASQTVDRMVQMGYLERTEDPNDRRVKQITLSARGKEMVKESIQARMSWFKDLVRFLSPNEQASIAESLRVLIRATHELEAQTPEPS
jgi:MarR family transcriptional regulator, organic hydroperoxide resistance regulator